MSVALYESYRGPTRIYTDEERLRVVDEFHTAIYNVLGLKGFPKEHSESIGKGMSFRFIRYEYSSTLQFVIENIEGSNLAYLFEWGGRRSKLSIKRTIFDMRQNGKQRVDSGMLSPEKARLLPAIIRMRVGENMSLDDLALLVRETLLLSPAQEAQLLQERARIS
ncbi:MAG: hypothetical protein HY426_00095 [Candidatus Levybacteria bacterium]|nr:hypothetical protein [Candidatus Levybacteria bacterium]